ncbi:hypothetical protein [Streptomyces sp. ITFR-6]|uniref:hypothetical protein n=1 Tax=Streptomyces sp. ITFR-6 TaxID=3075197 RepID=UPI00288963FA|nr:hypothetical protein [Streptomyces sp. ITFR-6]WNI34399.1 hypothetical protein RLT59_37915 [Streptomyces sp. ITFR-6]
MTDTTQARHDQPIEPTVVELSGERTDTTPPPPPPMDVPDPFLPPPRRRTPPTPPPAGPPAVPPHSPRPGGGVAAMAPPGPAPVTYVTNHYYPVAPEVPAPSPRFSLSRLSPVRNGTALVAGLTLLPVSGKVFHICGDEPGVMMAALAVAGILELRTSHDRVRSWLVRVLTCNILVSTVATPAGLHLYGYLLTGVWS